MLLGTHLGNKDETECGRRAEDNEDRYDDKGGVLLIAQYVGEAGADNAHDDDVVDAHADVLGVIQRRYAHLTRLPRQEDADRLSKIRKIIRKCKNS